MSKIVILGAGAGGIIVANLLVKSLTGWEAQVTLLSDRLRHLYQPGLPEVPFGWCDSRALSRPLSGLLQKSVRRVPGRVRSLDPQRRRIHYGKEDFVDYDYLVLATGCRLDHDAVPGFRQAAMHFHDEAAAHALQWRLQEFRGGTIAVATPSGPMRGPASMLQFAFLLDQFLDEQGIRESSRILFLHPGQHCYPEALVHDMALPLLQGKGIEVVSDFAAAELIPGETVTVRSKTGRSVACNLLVMPPEHRGPEFLRDTGWLDEHGWVRTDPRTLEVCEGVWALGDITNLPIPKTGSVAHFQAPVVSERILSRVLDRTMNPRFAEYLGHSTAFLETGRGLATMLDSDYERAIPPAPPSAIRHYQKLAFDRAYWYLVPTGVL